MLHERLSTRYGDAAARILIEQAILQNLTDNFFHGHVLTAAIEGFVNTGTDTCQTLITFPPVNDPPPLIVHGDRPPRAGLNALPASAAVCIPHQERQEKRLGFGVRTPSVLKRTSLQKNRCPYPGTVMNTKSLDIKNRPFSLLPLVGDVIEICISTREARESSPYAKLCSVL